MSNKLANTLASTSMSKMYLKSDFADVHFVFPNDNQAEKLPAHRAILATTSPVFAAMFFGPLKEGDTVEISDSNASAFKELLQFIYLPEVTLSIGNIEEVVRLADKYDMLDCLDTCAELLEANLTSENMVWGYQLAITLFNEPLMKFCEKHIRIYTDEILRSKMFLQCSRDVVAHIVKLDTLACDEVDLFNACVDWAKASCQKNGLDENDSKNLKSQLGPCFYSIRFSAMEAEEMAINLQSKVIEGLFTRDELANIWRSKWIKKPKLELFNHQPRSKPVFSWNAKNKLIGTRIIHTNHVTQYWQSTHYVWPQDSTWFSSNEFILLGEINFMSLNYNYNQPPFNVTIVEHNKYDFAKKSSNKLLYSKNNIAITSTTLILDKPIVIRPHKMYEIHLQNTKSTNAIYNDCTWLAVEEAKLDAKITIKFHPNPSDSKSDLNGWVSKLHFNRIE